MSNYTPSRRQFVASVGGTAILALAGCSTQADSSDETQTTSPPETTTAAATTTADETESPTSTSGGTEESDQPVVDMVTDNKGSYFDPVGRLVEPGTTVRFVNASGDHSATAYHPDNGDQPLRIPEGAASFDSGVFTAVDKTFEYTFEVEGVYDYYCRPHEALGMVGRIVVGAPQGGPATEPPDALPPGARDALPSIDSIVDETVVEGP